VDPNVKIAADRKNRKPRSTEKPGVPVPADGFTGNDLHKEKLPAKGLDGGFAGASEGRQGGPEGRPGNSLLRYRFALAAAAVALQGAIGVGGAGGGAVVVEVRFSGGSAGSPTLAITQSSGTDELDSTALALLARAARTVPAPPAVGGEALVVSMPVVFDFEGL
jgi:TonB family protein